MSLQKESNLMFFHPKQFIFDSFGSQYHLCMIVDNDNFFFVKLKHCDEIVGEAKCTMHLHEMVLEDILIYDEVVRTPQNFLDIFLKIAFNRNKTTNYRQRGLGTSLLKFLINYACYKGVKRISGRVVERDVANNPNLFQWYRKHGFQVITADEDILGTVAKIYMESD